MTHYVAVTIFTLTIAVGGPLWDRHVSADTNVEDTLWVVLAALVGVVVAAVVELAFARMKPGDNVVLPIAERLAAVESLLARYAEGGTVDHLADAVLLEFSSSRQQDLILRDRIRHWQPHLRALFLIQVALLKYRLRLPGFDLPEAVALAQQEFDAELAKVLEQTIRTCCSEGPQRVLTAELRTFLALSRSIDSLRTSLSKEI
jgi:hypothetical protein